MTLKIQFEFDKLQSWKYNKKIIQNLFYSLIDDQTLHDSTDYCLYCYSNIYSEYKQQFQPGKTYNLRFRSIDKDIINTVYKNLQNKKKNKKKIDFGKINKIKIKKVNKINKFKLGKQGNGKKIVTCTPIVISLDERLCKKYDIDYNVKSGGPLYWNKSMGESVFMNQLKRNIIRKYLYLLKKNYIDTKNRFDNKLLEKENKNKDELNKFAQDLDFFKQCEHQRDALIDYKGGKIAGSKWEFEVNNKKNLKKILRNVKQIGMGEKTSIGFGFID